MAAGMVVHTCNPSIWEVEAEEQESTESSGLYSETLSQNKQANKRDAADFRQAHLGVYQGL
jgi:hypothetical protein